MLLAAQILPMGLQSTGARPDVPAEEAGASEAFSALLAAESRDGERAQPQEKPAARTKAAPAAEAETDVRPSAAASDHAAETPVPGAAAERAARAREPGAASSPDAARAQDTAPADTDAPAHDPDTAAPAKPMVEPGAAAEPEDPSEGMAARPARDGTPEPVPGNGAREETAADRLAPDSKPAVEAKAAVENKTGSAPTPETGMLVDDAGETDEDAGAAERRNGIDAQDVRPRDGGEASRPAPPASSGPQTPHTPAAARPEADSDAADTEAEAETATVATRADAPAGQAAAQAADGEAVSRAAAQMETEEAAPRRERLAAHVRGEGEARAERASGESAASRSAERPQPSSAQPQPQTQPAAQPQPPAQPQGTPQPQPGAQGQAAAPLFIHPAGMRADAEPMPVRASEPAPDTLTETARIERAASDPARSPASQLQGQPHGPRLVPGHAAAMASLIARRFSDGARVFDIRLDPAELGRVDVRMKMGADGKAHIQMTAERAEALTELQKTQRELARELEEAGIELAEDGLSFELADSEDGSRHTPDEQTPGWIAATAPSTVSGPAPADGTPKVYGFTLHARQGLDLRA